MGNTALQSNGRKTYIVSAWMMYDYRFQVIATNREEAEKLGEKLVYDEKVKSVGLELVVEAFSQDGKGE